MNACFIAPTSTDLTSVEETVIKLREGGMSILKIKNVTGLPERQVRKLIAGIVKPAKTKQVVARIATPFDSATERVFQLAKRPTGISDYELRNILHNEYRSTWDTALGKYSSNYDNNTLKRVKENVRKRALVEHCNVIFVMDWIDKANPRASNDFLQRAASDLQDRIEGYVKDYMALYGTSCNDDADATALGRRKQHYAAKRHLLKLAVKGCSPEPIERLLERTATLVDALEGTPDASLPTSRMADGAGITKAAEAAYFPEPTRHDAFLDFAESQGWIHAAPKAEGR